MKIVNNTDSNILISDLNIVVPTQKRGCLILSDVSAIQSRQLISLLNSGKITATVEDTDVKNIISNGKSYYVIPGTVVWQGEGKTKCYHKIDVSSGVNREAKGLLLSSKKTKKKYRIKKIGNTSISLDAAGFVLTNKFPSTLIDESVYNSKSIQSAIKSGFIEMVEKIEEKYDENGNIVHSAVEDFDIKGEEESKLVRPDNTEFSNTEVIWEGPIFDSGGYANMNREYVYNLTKLGVVVKPTLVKTSDDVEQSLVQEITKLSHNKVNNRCPKVYATNVPGKNNGTVVSYTMMETETRVHPDLVKALSPASEMWVPSEWNRQVFLNSGVKIPMTVMPLGVNTDLYYPKERKVEYSFPTKKFVFYACSTWLWRKGFDVLIKAYSRAFTADDDVSLVLFTKWQGLISSPGIIQDINSYVSNKNSLPHLAIITSVLPGEVMPYMYNSIDAFVLFSRGEGWGLPYCEAAASGVPVIGADHGGQQMFLNDDNSFLVKPDTVATCPRNMKYISPFYPDMRFAEYTDNAINKASDAMRSVYENYDLAKQKAEKCMNNIVENYSWRKSSLAVAKRLRQL
jgi:glycosyltransferase involved in cell wall biosynthesis